MVRRPFCLPSFVALPLLACALVLAAAAPPTPAAAGEHDGTPLRVMAFNIWLGGHLDGRHEHGWEEQNRAQLVEFLRAEDPDVLFAVETYGAAEEILDGLNRDQPAGREFTGVQVTRPEHYGSNGDNLWLFTALEVEEVYPARSGGGVSTFHFGGARLGLPDGGHVHAFSIWLSHHGAPWIPTNATATARALDRDDPYTEEELLASDEEARMAMAETVLTERLPEYVDDDAPVIIGGDFNAFSHQDWSSQFADAPGHEGLVLDWPVMRAFDEAGFTDTYRQANPDVERFPGRTLSPAHAYGYAPGRVDYILTRGDSVHTTGSATRTERLPEHQGTALDGQYPFYSDHAAVISELEIGGDGDGDPGESDPPEEERRDWPDVGPVPGTPVPAAEMTASAESERGDDVADHAVDGSLDTIWHSRTQPDPPDPHAHVVDIDLGDDRVLAGLRYETRVDGGHYGTITEYTVHASMNGTNFRQVASGTWGRDPFPKQIDLGQVPARYLRFEVTGGVGGFSHIARLTPYEPDDVRFRLGANNDSATVGQETSR